MTNSQDTDSADGGPDASAGKKDGGQEKEEGTGKGGQTACDGENKDSGDMEAECRQEDSGKEKKGFFGKKKDPRDTQIEELTDRLKRSMAEFDNYRKRTQREKDLIYPDAVANTVKGFLELADGLERALEAPCADPEFKKGMEMTARKLFEQFERLKVEAIGLPGETFDPRYHNAVMHVEDEENEANTIVEVFQKGYKIGENVLRYAMVKVAN